MKKPKIYLKNIYLKKIIIIQIFNNNNNNNNSSNGFGETLHNQNK